VAERVVVNVGDLHCGSIYGLHPPGFVAGDEREIPQNVAQQYLWECWDHFGESVSDAPVAALVVNGDIVEGKCRKSSGGETCLIRTSDQCMAAEMCLRYLLDKIKSKPRVFFVAGTDYHVGDLAENEEAVAAALGAKPYRGTGAGQRVREVLNLDIDGVVGNFAHHLSFAPVNQSRPLEQEMYGARLAIAAGEHPPIDYIVRNHVHYGRVVDDGNMSAAACPCWQLQTKFGRRGGVFKFRLKLGGLRIWIDGAEKKRGRKAVWIEEERYSTPKPTVVKV
jgi:hypothetical protein